jgi:hypothetical protein
MASRRSSCAGGQVLFQLGLEVALGLGPHQDLHRLAVLERITVGMLMTR